METMMTRPSDRRPQSIPALVALLVSGAAATFCSPGALAQTADDSQNLVAANATGAAGDADINRNDDGNLVLEQVIVTARRRNEDAQDVPIPISAIGGAELEGAGQFRLEDLNQRLPSTNVQFNNPRQTSIAVRGLGNNPANDALESSVGVYLDGVYLGRASMGNLDLIDIDQIALLRGPQGTLFGKNTTAGVLNISTRAPTFTPEVQAEASYGDYNYFQLRGSASDALIGEQLAGRISVSRTYKQGFVTDVTDGRDLDGTSRFSTRGQLLWNPADAFSLRVIGDYNTESEDTGAGVLYSTGPNAGARYWAAIAAAGAHVVYDPDYETSTLDGRQHMQVRTGGASAEANWKLGGGYTITSISAWRSWFFHPENDADGTDLSAFVNAGQRVRDKQITEELRLASPTSDYFDWVAGLYYFNQVQYNDSYQQYGPNGTAIGALRLGAPAFVNGLVANHQFLKTLSGSAFAQATWHPVQNWEVTAGLRDTKERKDVHVEQANSNSTAPAFLATFPAAQTGPLQRDDNNVSALLSLSHKVNDSVLVYVSGSRGAKSGAIDPRIPAGGLPVSSLNIRPEVANDGELGIKTTWLDHKLTANANLFLTKVRDYQANLLVPPTVGTTFVQVLANVGGVRTRGVESEIAYASGEHFSLRLSASYNDAIYTDYHNAPCSAEALLAAGGITPGANGYTCDLTGQPLVGAPKWILNPGVQFAHTLGAFHGTAQVDYAWRSTFYGSADDSEFARVPAYGLLNARYGLELLRGESSFGIAFWAKNLLDKRYVLGGLATANALYSYSETPGEPRTYGVTLQAKL
jgi:iron complex outermembrane receptor protein